MKNVLTFCLSLLSMSVIAQEAKDFSLTEALNFALEHNAQMINADRDV